jgi:para-nitrobenzyl esterase
MRFIFKSGGNGAGHGTTTAHGQRDNRRFGAFLLASAGLALTGCASFSGRPQACGVDEGTVCTTQGAVRGTVDGALVSFKGIPYAKPPVGALRWRAPEAPAAWDGVRDGSRFGPICPQIAGDAVTGEEDCLTLNVWRPRAAREPLPVMVFFIGGGNHAFSGQGSPGFGGVNYNGELLVPEGVIHVSFNARLGALGFLAHPALGAERPEKVSGNYSSLDQIAMLRWLKDNIAAFGGDPKRIFLFGTSAGGANICALMTAPQARGLFHGAALQSSVPTGCELQTLAEAEQGIGRRVARALGCDDGRRPAETAACLRGKSAREIVEAVPGTFGVLPRIYGPNVDGHVFPDQPLARIARGEHAAMPVIVGSSTEETMQFVNALGPVTDAATYGGAIEKVFGAAARERIRSMYPPSAYATPRAAFVKLTTDALFTCQARRVARTLHAAQKQPVYRYLFAHALENDPQQKALGAVHTIEHAFLFPWQGQYRPTAADLEVQRLMVGHWTTLAKEGRLNDSGAAAWTAYTQANDAYLEIGATANMKSGPPDAHCAFWDSMTLPWPHL